MQWKYSISMTKLGMYRNQSSDCGYSNGYVNEVVMQ